MIFLDGKINTPACRCDDDCGFPCWQRVGIGGLCDVCGCPGDENPAYGPGNPDWEHDIERDRA